MLRWDEACFVAIVLVGTVLLALGASELLAQALKPVSDALMSGTKDITQVALGG